MPASRRADACSSWKGVGAASCGAAPAGNGGRLDLSLLVGRRDFDIASTGRPTPRLSPYLRAHADNPVDWQVWGDAAFDEARRRDVPVLISIGYATCHWCHVMARESFSDPAIARTLNEHFVSIKVDREEHPDVDGSYLAAASAFT